MESGSDYSRRVFLGLTAAGAAGLAAGCSADATSGSAEPARTPPRTRRRATASVSENSLAGDPHWEIRHLGAPMAIVGYAGQASVLPGEPITLYVSTTARSFKVSAFRMGWYNGDRARRLWKSGVGQGPPAARRVHDPPDQHGARRSGVNPSPCPPTTGRKAPTCSGWTRRPGAQRYVPVTVRSASTKGKVVIKNGTATWQAYNTWGGYDLYNGPGGIADYSNRSLAVSLDRPYDANGAYMFLYHERKTIELAERMGLPLAYVTSMEIDADPHLLDGASALITAGHDEYWSPPERAHVTAARNAGMNIAFMGANTMFRRTRIASTRLGQRRLVICYKTSYLQDPMYGKDNASGHQRLAGAAQPGPGVLADRHAVRVEPDRRGLRRRRRRTRGCSPRPGCTRAASSPGWSASSTTGSTRSTRCSGRSRCCPTHRCSAAA